jgi:hypothetical protein
MENLSNLVEAVSDRQSFLVFVKVLVADRSMAEELENESPSSPNGPGALGWENGSIATFLESAVAWTEDWKGKKGELPETPSWQSFARFLYAGKYYE